MSIPDLSRMEAEILRILAENPEGMYGLEMVRESDLLKRGTVYVTLNRLAQKGFVESTREDRGSEGGLPRRVFTHTGEGATAWRSWLAARRAAEEARDGRPAWTN